MNNSDEQSKATQTDVTPIAIDRDGDTAIEIKWSDQTVNHWTVAALRKACPCATCREKKRADLEKATEKSGPIGLPVLSQAEARPLRIESMQPVGTYAYNIAFSDGHSSGIFTFTLLRQSTENVQ